MHFFPWDVFQTGRDIGVGVHVFYQDERVLVWSLVENAIFSLVRRAHQRTVIKEVDSWLDATKA